MKDNKNFSYVKVRGAHSLTGNASALGGGSAYLADWCLRHQSDYTVAQAFPMALGWLFLSTLIAKSKSETRAGERERRWASSSDSSRADLTSMRPRTSQS
jgi:hypothetical protein